MSFQEPLDLFGHGSWHVCKEILSNEECSHHMYKFEDCRFHVPKKHYKISKTMLCNVMTPYMSFPKPSHLAVKLFSITRETLTMPTMVALTPFLLKIERNGLMSTMAPRNFHNWISHSFLFLFFNPII